MMKTPCLSSRIYKVQIRVISSLSIRSTVPDPKMTILPIKRFQETMRTLRWLTISQLTKPRLMKKWLTVIQESDYLFHCKHPILEIEKPQFCVKFKIRIWFPPNWKQTPSTTRSLANQLTTASPE